MVDRPLQRDVSDDSGCLMFTASFSLFSSADKVQQDVIACIGWQMKADRKIGALKAFQGYMWKEGYTNGDLKGEYVDMDAFFSR